MVDIEEFESELEEALSQAIREKDGIVIDGPVKPIDIDRPDVSLSEIEDIHLFVDSDCEPCERAKEELSGFIDSGVIEIRDISSSDNALKLTGRWNVDRVPMLVFITEDGLERV